MIKQPIIIAIVTAILLIGGFYWLNGYIYNEKQGDNQVNTNVPVEEVETEEFTKTGSEEMNVCNSKAICHRGQVVFAAGEVMTITDTNGREIEIEDSTCDQESCYVEDVNGQEWDLVWIESAVTPPVRPPKDVVCTMDAKVCPDGSYVGRIPPDCQFAACPGE